MPVRMDTTPIPCSNSVTQALAGTGDLYYRSAAWSREPERRDGFTTTVRAGPLPEVTTLFPESFFGLHELAWVLAAGEEDVLDDDETLHKRRERTTS